MEKTKKNPVKMQLFFYLIFKIKIFFYVAQKKKKKKQKTKTKKKMGRPTFFKDYVVDPYEFGVRYILCRVLTTKKCHTLFITIFYFFKFSIFAWVVQLLNQKERNEMQCSKMCVCDVVGQWIR